MAYRLLKKYLTQNSNVLALYLYYATNILYPLIIYWRIVPIIGNIKYGEIIFYYSFYALILLIIDFGWDNVGIKIIRESKKPNEIYSNLLIFKILISVPLILITYFFSRFNPLSIFTSHILLYSIVFAPWYYIGMSRSIYFATINFIFKALSIVALLFLVSKEDDNAYIAIVPFALLLIPVLKKIYNSIPYFSIKLSYIIIKETKSFFSISILSHLVKSSPKIILGSVNNLEGITQYDLIERFTAILKIPNQIITKNLISKVKRDYNRTIKVQFIKSLTFNLLIILIFYTQYEKVINFLGFIKSSDFDQAMFLSLILILIIFLNNVANNQYLLINGKYSQIQKATLIAFVTFVIFIIFYLLINQIDLKKTIYALMIFEITILITSAITINKMR